MYKKKICIRDWGLKVRVCDEWWILDEEYEGGGGVIMIYKEWYVLGMMLRERVGLGCVGECMFMFLG